MTKTEKLEIEEDDARQKRLQNLLERMSTNEPAPNPGHPPFPAPPAGLPKFDFGNPATSEFSPNTELLSRIQAFLPQLEASNRELLERAKANPASVDIEHLEDDGKDGYIEMNLGLGVYEQRLKRRAARKAAKKAAKAAASAGHSPLPPDEDDAEMASSSSSSSSASDSEDDASDSDSSANASSSDDPDSDSSMDDNDDSGPDPLTSFFQSLPPHPVFNNLDGDSTDGSDADDDNESASSGEEDGGENIPVGERVIKPLPKTMRRPVIEVLSETTTAEGEAGRGDGGGGEGKE